jgi:hypothetical protein
VNFGLWNGSFREFTLDLPVKTVLCGVRESGASMDAAVELLGRPVRSPNAPGEVDAGVCGRQPAAKAAASYTGREGRGVGEESISYDMIYVCNALSMHARTRTRLLTSPCGASEIPQPISVCRGRLVASKVSQSGADGELSIQHTSWMMSAARIRWWPSCWPRGSRFGADLQEFSISKLSPRLR